MQKGIAKIAIVAIAVVIGIVAVLAGWKVLSNKSGDNTIVIENSDTVSEDAMETEESLEPEGQQPDENDPTNSPSPTPKVTATTAPVTQNTTNEVPAGGHPCKINPDCNADEYCAKATCEATSGACAKKPTSCTSVFQVVCSCSGGDYQNECFARKSGFNVRHPGSC